uniref:Ig-like domain-containing protein n=1 Tax=Xenopus tropicalis TaxID=8364 RepID=A0A6I8RV79_XENTR
NKWTCHLIPCYISILGSRAQQLIQPPSVSISQGNQATMSCELSKGTSISSYSIRFYQQRLGNNPRFLLWYGSDSSKGQGTGVPDRFSGSKDISKNAGYITIRGALLEDDADYHCAIWHSPSSSLVQREILW